MRNLFIQTFKMNIAIFSNTIIYRLRSLPFIKNIIPNSLYGNEGISAVLTIFMCFLKGFIILLKKAIYLLLIIVSIYVFKEAINFDEFLIALIIFSVVGSISNNKLLEATKEKYYAVILMRIDANQFAKMDFMKEMIINYISFTITLCLIGFIFDFNIMICLILPIFIIANKIIMSYLITCIYDHSVFKVLESNLFYIILLSIAIFITAAFIALSITIPNHIFIILTFILAILAVYCYRQFMHAKCFKDIYKTRLTLNKIIFDMNASTAAATKNSLNKKISYDKDFHSNKYGYEYFNELFTQRHRKILTNSAFRFAGIYLLITASIILLMLFQPQFKDTINALAMIRIPYFLIVMYFTNRGAIITQAMFVNCDSSMLHYRFYRQPEVILGLFRQRLKTVITVNLIPSLVIAVGLCLCLYISGGTKQPLNYLLIFLCINAMSAFFSVHYLVLYYVLQPYNINMQAKGTLYGIISMITYLVCFQLMNVRLATFPFTIAVIVFSIIYILISLIIANKYAYKTFKIKN